MEKYCYVFVCASLLLLFIEQGTAISCYECNSFNDSRCALEKPPDSLKITCPERFGDQYIMCRKILQIMDFEMDGKTPGDRIIRTCGWDPNASYLNRCYRRSGFGGTQMICACDKDYCNDSDRVSNSMWILTASCLLQGVLLKVYS